MVRSRERKGIGGRGADALALQPLEQSLVASKLHVRIDGRRTARLHRDDEKVRLRETDVRADEALQNERDEHGLGAQNDHETHLHDHERTFPSPPRRRLRTVMQQPPPAGDRACARQARRHADEHGHQERDRRHVPGQGRGRGARKDAAFERQAELEQPPRDQHGARRRHRRHARRRGEVRDQDLAGCGSQRPQGGKSLAQTAPARGKEPANVQAHEQQH